MNHFFSLISEEPFAPEAAEGEEGLKVARAVLLLVHAEGELPREGLGALHLSQMGPKERVVQDALRNEGEAHAVDDHPDDGLEAVDVGDDVVFGKVQADLRIEEDARARALFAWRFERLPG